MDSTLRSEPATYGQLLERPAAAGMIEYRRSGKPRCGLFAVHKKAGRQRLIVDARLSNCCFVDRAPVSLCSGATLGLICMEEGEKLFVGQVDTENAFYGMLLPEEFVSFFCLPRLKARYTNVERTSDMNDNSGCLRISGLFRWDSRMRCISANASTS